MTTASTAQHSPRGPASPADIRIVEWLQRIRGEYVEFPGLHLTEPQAQRLWGLDPVTCGALLSALVDVKFLKRTRVGAYLRADQG